MRTEQRPARWRQQLDMYRALASTVSQPAYEDIVGDAHPRPAAIPGYEFLDVLGRGSTSVVHLAWAEDLDRLAAVKVFHGGAHAGSSTLARCRVEADTLRRLHHPNVVEFYAVGHHGGRAFCALEYVEGGDLRHRLNGSARSARRSAKLVAQCAHALDSVHRLGVVHRDLSPGNILLTADGRPKIADFALAVRPESGTRHTLGREITGTPRYMAPEQIDPAIGAVGPATDLYALGAILYELMTGRPPHHGSTFPDIAHQIRQVAPIPPSRLAPSTPGDLEAICLRCLEKEPARRYASAAELAHDLEAFLERGDR